MNFRKVALFATVLALVSVSAWAQAPPCNINTTLLICQPFDNTGNAYSSQNDTNGLGNFATVYDNYGIGFGGADNFYTVQSVHWIGEYFNPPNQGPITGWTVSTYLDCGRQPCANALFTQHTSGTDGETFLGNFGGFPTYVYWAMVNWPDLNKGQQYWLSVIPDLGFPPQWGWSSAGLNGCVNFGGCDTFSIQDFFGVRSSLAADMAFALDGCFNRGCGVATTPEPGTLIMLGSGILGLAGGIRRKLV
jgi:hypothetical protein